MDNKKLFVGNLPWSLSSHSLKELFAVFGEIVDSVIISDRATGRSKGFGFVTFSTEESAKKAESEMNNKEIEGRAIVVNVAKPKTDKPDGFRRDNNNFRRNR